MKLGRYIINIVPHYADNFRLNIPHDNYIWYSVFIYWRKWKNNNAIECKHIKPNSGIQYSILGKFWIFLIIKELK